MFVFVHIPPVLSVLLIYSLKINSLLFLAHPVGVVQRIKDTSAPFYRPPLPQRESEGVHPGILTLMKQCWAEEPSERPSFNDITKALKTINEGRSLLLFTLLHSPTVLFQRNVDSLFRRAVTPGSDRV